MFSLRILEILELFSDFIHFLFSAHNLQKAIGTYVYSCFTITSANSVCTVLFCIAIIPWIPNQNKHMKYSKLETCGVVIHAVLSFDSLPRFVKENLCFLSCTRRGSLKLQAGKNNERKLCTSFHMAYHHYRL